ncbi:MAG: corrinoid ABC transporter substrate-binding protein [Candidatus Methanolliviera sp. GoM_oil]|nr:MAG: corrinoid ABC transporter substrate-binding protein [Candidatus Methanolliviera sp. GoM_oil]
MNKKIFAGIAIACLILLVSLMPPVLSRDVDIGAGDTLGVYGNANEDDTIDERDITYVKEIITGKRRATKLADANYDGKINVDDITQIRAIIAGREKELTIIDSEGNAKTIPMPIETIVTLNPDSTQAVRLLGEKEKIVGIEVSTWAQQVFFPHIASNAEEIGMGAMPDIEAIQELDPDIVIVYAPGIYNPPHETVIPGVYVGLEENLEPEIPVLRLDLYAIPTVRDEVRRLGYLLDAEDKADEYVEWYDRSVNPIIDRGRGISDAEKPDFYTELGLPFSMVTGWERYGSPVDETIGLMGLGGMPHMTMTDDCMWADMWTSGGKNIADDLPSLDVQELLGNAMPRITEILGMVRPIENIVIMKGASLVEHEWIIEQDPEVIPGLAAGFNFRVGGYETDNPAETDVSKLYLEKYIPVMRDIARHFGFLMGLMIDADEIGMKPYYDDLREEFGGTTAGYDDRIFVLHHTVVCGPGSPVGLAYLAKILQPEIYSDLDPVEMQQQYVDQFTGINFDVSKHGVFVYPPLPG